MTTAEQPDVASSFNRSLAVVIGINEYGAGVPALGNAVNDAVKVADRLKRDHGFKIIARTDRNHLPLFTEISDNIQEASLENLKELLYVTLPQEVKEGDRVLVYWAGHGERVDSENYGPDGYLLPSDAQLDKIVTYLHMPSVHDALLRLPCRHMMVVLDACFAGAFKWAGMRNIGRQKGEVVQRTKYERFVKDPAWQVISSAASDEKALDANLRVRPDSGRGSGHSPFAEALIAALQRNPPGRKENPADTNDGGRGDGLVTAHELFVYIDEQLGEMEQIASVRQTAQLWPLKKHDKGEFVFQVGALKLAEDPPLNDANNPWVGLRSYDEGKEDAARFFGRADEIERLVRQVEEAKTRLTVVVGASGSGKSSLVRAGLVPALKAPVDAPLGKYQRQKHWDVLPVVRPGGSPFRALLHKLEGSDPGPTLELTAAHRRPTSTRPNRTTPPAGDHPKAERIRQLVRARAEDTDVALVIDRFEELITLGRSSADRDQFLEFLAGLLADNPRLHLIVTVRSDYAPAFETLALKDRWSAGRFEIAPMSRNDLRKVIELPAALAVLYFDPSDLVETLVDAVVETPGALPLLSFVLHELYRAYQREPNKDRAITKAMYDALGGVAGALKQRADETYHALGDQPPGPEPSAQQRMMEQVMLRMVARDGGHLVGRRATARELEYPRQREEAAENELRDNVLNKLMDAGLVVTDREPHADAGNDGTTKTWAFAHDALAQRWEPLQAWIRRLDEAAGPGTAAYSLEQRRRLARAAGDWEHAPPKSRSAGLWDDGARSAQLKSLVKGPEPWLNQREIAFAEKSVASRRFKNTLTYSGWVTIAALVFIALVLGVRATALAARATSRQLGAATSNALGNGYLDLAALLSAEASGLPAGNTRAPILNWQLSTARLHRYLNDPNMPYRVALSPDNRALAATGDSGTVLWDFTRIHDSVGPRTFGQLPPGAGANAIAFSPDGRTLASAGASGSAIHQWSVPARTDSTRGVGDTLLPIDTVGLHEKVTSLAYSPDGKMLATASNEMVILWNVEPEDSGGSPAASSRKGATSLRPRDTTDSRRSHIDVGAETDARRSSGNERTIDILIDRRRRGAALDSVRSLVFGPDSRTLALVSRDSVTLWTINRRFRVVKATDSYWKISGENPGEWPRIYRRTQPDRMAHPHWIYPGDVLDLGIGTPTHRCLANRAGCIKDVVSVAFSPDSQTIAVATRGDTSVVLWDVRTGRPRGDTVGGLAGGATVVAFSQDMSLAVGTQNGAVMLWQVPRRGRPVPIGAPLTRHVDAITGLAFDSTGRSLVSASDDGKILTWNVTGRLRASPVRSGDSADIAIGRGGRIIPSVSGGWVTFRDGPNRVRIRDTLLGAPLDSVFFDVFPPSRGPETMVAAMKRDGTVRLWKVIGDSVERVGVFPRRGLDLATSVGFSRDGKTLAVGTADGAVISLSGTDLRRIGSSRQHSGRVTSLAYSPDGYTLASAADTTVILWDAETMRPLGAPLYSDSAKPIERIAFSPHSDALMVVSQGNSISHWDFRVDSLKRRACQAAGRNLTDAEWRESFGDEYRRACNQYPALGKTRGTGRLARARGGVVDLWARVRDPVVRWLADSPKLLDIMRYAWAGLASVLLAWVWLVWPRVTRWRRRLWIRLAR
ncbi:MAG: caspase family protein [Gemmatimonadales bacterium]